MNPTATRINELQPNNKMNWFKKFMLYALVLGIITVLGYFTFLYYVPYSEGVQSGELIKISKRGNLSKTWEGEISQGISGGQRFKFSVLDNDKAVIDSLKEFQGKFVKVEYVERYKTFFWWGETRFFIVKAEKENSPYFTNE